MSNLEETLLWQIRVAGLPSPVREYSFAPGRRYRADLAWPNERLIVELEGGIFSSRHSKGRGGWHQSIQRMLTDMEKYNLMAMTGWRLLRFAANHVKSGEALMVLERALGASPTRENMAL